MSKGRNSSFTPNYAVPPGGTLRETLESLGMAQTELAERSGRPKKTINEIITGKTAITAETALQFEHVLGVPASFWNNLERNYRETLARLAEEKQLATKLAWLRTFPIHALTKSGWLPKEDSPIRQLQALLTFFGVAGIEEWESIWTSPRADFRRSPAFQANPVAMAAWLRRGEIEAAEIVCQTYKEEAFLESIKQARSLTVTLPDVFEPRIKKSCAEAGVAVVFVPELPGTHVFGATRWLSSSKALVQLSLRGKSDDLLWFTFFHEAAHILLHGKREVFIEGKGGECRESEPNTEKELEANQFACDILIPREEYLEFTARGCFEFRSIQAFAKQSDIAPGIVVGRLQHDRLIPFSRCNSLKLRFRFVES